MFKPRSLIGFTLLEMLVAVAILAILASIAIPLYQGYVVRGHRAAATACLTEAAHFMERFHTLNMRYDEDSEGSPATLPNLECATQMQAQYAFALASTTSNSYSLTATPRGSQADQDTECGMLSLDQTGLRSISGDGEVNRCW